MLFIERKRSSFRGFFVENVIYRYYTFFIYVRSINVKTFKYLGSLVTNQNPIEEEIKCRLKVGNVQTFLSSRLLFKNLKIKIHKTIILPVVLYGCET